MSRYTLVHCKTTDRCRYRLRFGDAVQTIRFDEYNALSAFKPYQVFGYIRWKRNDFGTQSWLLFICEIVPSARLTRVPGLYPGAEILFRARGKVAVKRTLSWLVRLEKKAQYPLELLPASYWRQAQNAALIHQPMPDYRPIGRPVYA